MEGFGFLDISLEVCLPAERKHTNLFAAGHHQLIDLYSSFSLVQLVVGTLANILKDIVSLSEHVFLINTTVFTEFNYNRIKLKKLLTIKHDNDLRGGFLSFRIGVSSFLNNFMDEFLLDINQAGFSPLPDEKYYAEQEIGLH